MSKTFFIIYKTTNIKNNKFYIGMHKTKNLDDDYLGSGKVLTNSVKYHGQENFRRKILHLLDSEDEMIQKEIEIVNEKLIQDPSCMNLQLGGTGGGGWRSKEHQMRCSIAGNLAAEKTGKNKKKLKWLRENDKEWVKNLSKKLSNKTRGQILVKDKKGNNFRVSLNDPRYLSGELINFNIGTKRSDETKNKMSLAAIARSKNSSWIYNPDKKSCIMAKNEDLDEFLLNGWKKGRKRKF